MELRDSFALSLYRHSQHQAFAHDLLNPLFIRLDPNHAIFRKAPGTIRQKSNRLEKVFDENGFEYIELKLAVRARDRNGGMVPHDLGCDHSQGFTLGRIDSAAGEISQMM